MDELDSLQKIYESLGVEPSRPTMTCYDCGKKDAVYYVGTVYIRCNECYEDESAKKFTKQVAKVLAKWKADRMTKFQKEFMEKWVKFAYSVGWDIGKPEEWASTFEISKGYNHPLSLVYDIYPSMKELRIDLEKYLDAVDDWTDEEKARCFDRCRKAVLNQSITMSDGQVVFIYPEGMFEFIQNYLGDC